MKFQSLQDLKQDMHDHPNKYLDDQGKVSLVGEETTTFCPVCNSEQEIVILEGASGKCMTCGKQMPLDLEGYIQ